MSMYVISMHIHCRYNNLDSIIEQNIREVGVHGRSVVGGKIILPTIAISNVLVIGRWWAAAGRSGTLVWRVAKGRLYWMHWRSCVWRAAAGRHCGRAKGAMRLRLESALFLPSILSDRFPQQLNISQHKTFVFRFCLARLWRALISSTYIYIYIKFL